MHRHSYFTSERKLNFALFCTFFNQYGENLVKETSTKMYCVTVGFVHGISEIAFTRVVRNRMTFTSKERLGSVCVIHSHLLYNFRSTFSAPTDSWRTTLDIRAKTHSNLHALPVISGPKISDIIFHANSLRIWWTHTRTQKATVMLKLINISSQIWPCHASGEGPVSIPNQSMWVLWWTKWHWNRCFSEYLGFPHSVSFPKYSTLLLHFSTIDYIQLVLPTWGSRAARSSRASLTWFA